MDWPAIASILAERGERPLALLDRAGRIRLLNRAMEELLGFNRFEVEGRDWASVCGPFENELPPSRWTSEALRGALRNCEVVARSKTGRRVAFHFEFSLVGRGANQGLLMTALDSRPLDDGTTTPAGMDLDYEVSVAGPSFGSLVRLFRSGECLPIASGGSHCYAVIHGQQRPCQDCPLLHTANAPWPRIVVRPGPMADGPRSAFQVITAESLTASLVRVKVRNICETTLDAIQQAKVEKLAAQANLSRREREVLSYLLLGRSIEDMAKLIGISPRTVKHHQASVLEKLGADSRADLMRLVF